MLCGWIAHEPILEQRSKKTPQNEKNERGSQHDKHNLCFFFWQRKYPYLGGNNISNFKKTKQSYKGNTISGFESFTLNPDQLQVS